MNARAQQTVVFFAVLAVAVLVVWSARARFYAENDNRLKFFGQGNFSAKLYSVGIKLQQYADTHPDFAEKLKSGRGVNPLTVSGIMSQNELYLMDAYRVAFYGFDPQKPTNIAIEARSIYASRPVHIVIRNDGSVAREQVAVQLQ